MPLSPQVFKALEQRHSEAVRDRWRAEAALRRDQLARQNSPEYLRARSRLYGARYRARRSRMRPGALHCWYCRVAIQPHELAILAHRSADSMLLDPYVDVHSTWPWTGAFHEWCMPPLERKLPAWRLQYNGGVRETNCEVCGRRVSPPRHHVRRDGTGFVYFCSQGCSPAALELSRRIDQQPIACLTCGEVFTPKRRDAVTCSPKCRQKAHRRRRALDGATSAPAP